MVTVTLFRKKENELEKLWENKYSLGAFVDFAAELAQKWPGAKLISDSAEMTVWETKTTRYEAVTGKEET